MLAALPEDCLALIMRRDDLSVEDKSALRLSCKTIADSASVGHAMSSDLIRYVVLDLCREGCYDDPVAFLKTQPCFRYPRSAVVRRNIWPHWNEGIAQYLSRERPREKETADVWRKRECFLVAPSERTRRFREVARRIAESPTTWQRLRGVRDVVLTQMCLSDRGDAEALAQAFPAFKRLNGVTIAPREEDVCLRLEECELGHEFNAALLDLTRVSRLTVTWTGKERYTYYFRGGNQVLERAHPVNLSGLRGDLGLLRVCKIRSSEMESGNPLMTTIMYEDDAEEGRGLRRNELLSDGLSDALAHTRVHELVLDEPTLQNIEGGVHLASSSVRRFRSDDAFSLPLRTLCCRDRFPRLNSVTFDGVVLDKSTKEETLEGFRQGVRIARSRHLLPRAGPDLHLFKDRERWGIYGGNEDFIDGLLVFAAAIGDEDRETAFPQVRRLMVHIQWILSQNYYGETPYFQRAARAMARLFPHAEHVHFLGGCNSYDGAVLHVLKEMPQLTGVSFVWDNMLRRAHDVAVSIVDSAADNSNSKSIASRSSGVAGFTFHVYVGPTKGREEVENVVLETMRRRCSERGGHVHVVKEDRQFATMMRVGARFRDYEHEYKYE